MILISYKKNGEIMNDTHHEKNINYIFIHPNHMLSSIAGLRSSPTQVTANYPMPGLLIFPRKQGTKAKHNSPN